jgi:hypothetical protein
VERRHVHIQYLGGTVTLCAGRNEWIPLHQVDRPDDLSAALTAPIDLPSRDLRKARPVSEPVFEAWRHLPYTFDHADLHAEVEAVDDSSREWRIEKVSYAAAYGDERITAYLFLPKNAKPPYQVMGQLDCISAPAPQRPTSTGTPSLCGAAVPSCT